MFVDELPSDYQRIIREAAAIEEKGVDAARWARSEIGRIPGLLEELTERLLIIGISKDIYVARNKTKDAVLRQPVTHATARNRPEAMAVQGQRLTILDTWRENGKPIGDLNREDVDELVVWYAARTRGYGEMTRFWRRIQKQMTGRRVLRKIFSAKQIDEIWHEIRHGRSDPEPAAA
jgi:hypothetical protein